MASVLLENVVKEYREQKAVRDFTLEVRDREFVVIVGPSGCGKTTALRMIAGLEEVTAGRIYIGDRLVNDVLPRDRNIAMVFQNYALYPNMTVFENMAFGLKLRGDEKQIIRCKVEETAQMLDIERYLERKPAKLSGGERQRVAIGRALVREPDVFLMDEPLSNLDAKLRDTMRTEILKLHRKLQATFIYVTHDQVEAMTLGDRIVVMRDGVIQQADTPDNVYTLPVNRYVAEFIGSPPMNFLPALLLEDGGRFYGRLGETGEPVLLPASAGSRPGIRGGSGRKVLLGIRPEHIRMDPSGPVFSCLDATLDVVERMGSETLLHLRLGGREVIARTACCLSIREGDALAVHLPAENMMVFDAVTGENIMIEAAVCRAGADPDYREVART